MKPVYAQPRATLLAVILTLTPPLARAEGDAFTKSPERIDFNQMITDSESEVKGLSSKMGRQPDSASKSGEQADQPDQVDPAKAGPTEVAPIDANSSAGDPTSK